MKKKKIRIIHLKTVIFLVVKFSVYLNRLVLVMLSFWVKFCCVQKILPRLLIINSLLDAGGCVFSRIQKSQEHAFTKLLCYPSSSGKLYT